MHKKRSLIPDFKRLTMLFGLALFAVPGSTFPAMDTWEPVNIPVSDTIVWCVLSDPVRRMDCYAFTSSGSSTVIHVLKSTDYGQSWSLIYTGGGSGMTGDPWGQAIDPNTNRNPATLPTMYGCCGYGANGIWKSTDGGITWKKYSASSVLSPFCDYAEDYYSVTILPDNLPNHIVVTHHGNWWKNGVGTTAGFIESFDGGVTWDVHQPAATNFGGNSAYLLALDSKTWFIQNQWESNVNGIWKTTTGGRSGGVPAASAWKQVGTIEHQHGCWQGFYDSTSGALFTTGAYGDVYRSLDKGESWSVAYHGSETHLLATPRYLYACYANGKNNNRALRTTTTQWTAVPGELNAIGYCTPAGTVTFDGTHWVLLIGGGNSAKIWRLMESAYSTKVEGKRILSSMVAGKSPLPGNNWLTYDLKGQRIGAIGAAHGAILLLSKHGKLVKLAK